MCLFIKTEIKNIYDVIELYILKQQTINDLIFLSLLIENSNYNTYIIIINALMKNIL